MYNKDRVERDMLSEGFVSLIPNGMGLECPDLCFFKEMRAPHSPAYCGSCCFSDLNSLHRFGIIGEIL